MNRRLDRKVQFDERSRGFRAVEGIEHLPFRNYTWPLNVWLDQGSEGACVGFGIAHELAAVPIAIDVNDSTALQIYNRAKQLDPWPGENYSGTSVLAGMKSVQELANVKGQKYIAEYRWAFGLEDLVRVLGRKGPAVIGVNWYTGMFDTDHDGYIHVAGAIEGGHCILAKGIKIAYLTKGDKRSFSNVDLNNSYIVLHNSWGRDWGMLGTAKINLADMDRLLKEQGECVVPITRNK